MSVRNRVLPAGNQRVFGATVIASVMLFGAACHNGVETPISPSTTTGSVPTATSAALAADGDTATTRGGPLSFVMSEVEVAAASLSPSPSGFSGTCTLGTGGAGFRIKASGQGDPDAVIRFILEKTDGFRYTEFVTVDSKGNFRTGQERILFLDSGTDVSCKLIDDEDYVVLAASPLFKIP